MFACGTHLGQERQERQEEEQARHEQRKREEPETAQEKKARLKEEAKQKKQQEADETKKEKEMAKCKEDIDSMSSKLISAQMLMDGLIRDECYDGLNGSFKKEVACINDKI